MKKVITRQYQEIVDNAARHVADLSVPPEGWLRTMRKALGMSGAQLARRLGVSRAQVSQAEKNELAGVITLKTLRHMAEGMGCRVVYAIVPESSAGDIVAERAREKAQQLIHKTSAHMALEQQSLDEKQLSFELDRLQRELIQEMPSDLWNDD